MRGAFAVLFLFFGAAAVWVAEGEICTQQASVTKFLADPTGVTSFAVYGDYRDAGDIVSIDTVSTNDTQVSVKVTVYGNDFASIAIGSQVTISELVVSGSTASITIDRAFQVCSSTTTAASSSTTTTGETTTGESTSSSGTTGITGTSTSSGSGTSPPATSSDIPIAPGVIGEASPLEASLALTATVAGAFALPNNPSRCMIVSCAVAAAGVLSAGPVSAQTSCKTCSKIAVVFYVPVNGSFVVTTGNPTTGTTGVPATTGTTGVPATTGMPIANNVPMMITNVTFDPAGAVCRGTSVEVRFFGTGFETSVPHYRRGGAFDGPAMSNAVITNTSIVATISSAVDNPTEVYLKKFQGTFLQELTAEWTATNIPVSGSVTVFYVDPPAVYNGVSTEIVIWTTGNTEATTEVLLRNNLTNVIFTFNASDIVNDVTNFNRVRVTIPENFATGFYFIRTKTAGGCGGNSLSPLIEIKNLASVVILKVDPPFVPDNADSAITVYGDYGSFQDIPRLFISPSGASTGKAIPLKGTKFETDYIVTGVIPAGTTAGSYDLLVVNPDQSIGVLKPAVTVTQSNVMIPIIDSVKPGYLKTNTDNLAEILGSGFDINGVKLEMECKEWVDGSVTYIELPPSSVSGGTACCADVSNNDQAACEAKGGCFITENKIQAVLKQALANSVCVVKVTNIASGVFSEFQALSARLPSSKLGLWKSFDSANVKLNIARRGSKGEAASVTRGNKFLYVLGGDDGRICDGAKYDTIEYSPLNKFGDLLGFAIQQYRLPEPVSFGDVVRIGRFLYYTGGVTGTGATCDVSNKMWRAEILDPLQTPETDLSLTLSEGGGTTALGIFYYRVSARFGPLDENNPDGEGLGGELLTIYMPSSSGLSANIKLTWTAIPGAIGYNVYRSPTANLGANSLRLIHNTTCVGDVATGGEEDCRRYSDDLSPPIDPNKQPLYIGETGVWHDSGTTMSEARWAHASFAVPSHNVSGKWFVNSIAGKNFCDDCNNNTGRILGDQEYAPVVVAPVDTVNTPLVRETQAVSPFRAPVQPYNIGDGVSELRFMAAAARIGQSDLEGLIDPNDSGVVLGVGKGIENALLVSQWLGNYIKSDDSSDFAAAWQIETDNAADAFGGCLHQAFGILHNIGGYDSKIGFPENFDVAASGQLRNAGRLLASASGFGGLCQDQETLFVCNNFAGENVDAKVFRASQACVRENGLFYQCGGITIDENGAYILPSTSCIRVPQ